MSSMLKKFKKNKMIDIKMSMRFSCLKCGFEKVIAKEIMDNIDPKDFKDNIIFKCPNCNIRMYPITVEVDY